MSVPFAFSHGPLNLGKLATKRISICERFTDARVARYSLLGVHKSCWGFC